jgi:D-glycero-alpha-D-manno-heptose 1-phosphate guanylyltransferase
MNTKEVIVLAGGLGSRLKGVLPDIPKCMAPVQGKPFLMYVLDYLAHQQICKVILSVAYRKEQIISFFGDKYNSMAIEYSIENEPLGTGGAVKHALNLCAEGEVFALNGDTYFIADLVAMGKVHVKSSANVTIAVKHMTETARYGLISANKQGRITDFREKDPSLGSGWINGGIYLLNREIFNGFPHQKFSLENDFFKTKVSELTLHAFQSDGFFLDIGIPEDYAKAQTMKTAPWQI